MPTGTILLIDDEAVLRQAVARTLELEGYLVRQAPDAMRGLEALREFADETLVVLSDVQLPNGRGLEPGGHEQLRPYDRHSSMNNVLKRAVLADGDTLIVDGLLPEFHHIVPARVCESTDRTLRRQETLDSAGPNRRWQQQDGSRPPTRHR